MSIKIDEKKCISCDRCTHVCPGNLIYLDSNKKAKICDPKECWDCAACIKECPVQAIKMYLFPEVGGSGGTLQVIEEEHIMTWQIKDKGIVKEEIKIYKKDSNKF
jgi:adenylylsulfate reductase subunit B